MNEFGFFGSKNGDRTYNSDDFSAYFSDIFTNGILGDSAGNLQVVSASGMDLTVKRGIAYINGRFFRPTTDKTITVNDSDTEFPRIDLIVLRCDFINREIYLDTVMGVSNDTPTAPELTRNSSVYELGLASVYIAPNVTSISQADIPDLRFDNNYCGVVTGVVDQVDTTYLFAQYEAQWELLRAACAQDEAAVIAAWDSLNTVKKVNGVEPVNGNVSLVQGDIPSGKNAYQLPFLVQAGTVTKASPMTVTFPVAYKTAPVVVCTPYLAEGSGTSTSGSNYYFKTMTTTTGITIYSASGGAYDGVNWVAFGEV